jgi:2-keto-4-pentenoate hydratase
MSQAFAKALWTARIEGGLVGRDAEGAPATEDAAYATQAAQIALADSRRIGWKLGATGQASLGLLGLEKPFIGPLFERFRFDSGAQVPISADHSPGLETEFSVLLGADLPSRDEPYGRAEIDAAVAAVCPSFEIIGFRVEGGAAGAGHLLTADGGANMAAVFGAPIEDWQRFDLSDHPVRVHLNGEPLAEGSNAVLFWNHTMDAVVWLANHPAMAGQDLRAGEIIMTGTTTGLHPLSAGDEARADFGGMGEVRARFV